MSFLKKVRDTSLIRRVRRTMDDQRWVDLFSFTAWLVEWLTHLQSWGGSCICHQADYELRNPVDCKRMGRLLPYACGKAQS
eukprot:4215553-Pyramimonas_sp.AAC.1